MRQLTVEIRLEGPDDVNSALEALGEGNRVFAVAGTAMQRPKSDLLYELIRYSSASGAEVEHQRWITKGVVRRRPYRCSCLLLPARPRPDDPSGVREPRRPKPNPPGLRAERNLDFDSR